MFEIFSRLGERYAVLWTPRPRHARLDRRKIERDYFGIGGLRRVFRVEESLLLAVGFDKRELIIGTARHFEIAKSLAIDRENAAGGAVLRGHVRDGGAIRQRQLCQSFAKE